MLKHYQKVKALLVDIPRDEWTKHGVLFILTFLSTTATGLFMTDAQGLPRLMLALSYSVPIMIILTGHEMGHYISARLYGVPVSLPYFIPLPFLSPFGTMGAFIRMRSMPPDRRSLFDIAFWGPAMSFFLSIPFLVIGLYLSEVHRILPNFNGFIYGDSLLTKLAAGLFFNVPNGYEVYIHPMAFAAWAGFFVTAINLFPIGQLDGGHIAYAVLGKRQREISYLFLAILIFLSFEFSGWFLWILILIFMGLNHPPLPSEYFHNHPLDSKRKKMALFSAVMLILCFVPYPVQQKVAVPIDVPYSPEHNRQRSPQDVQPDEYQLKVLPSTKDIIEV